MPEAALLPPRWNELADETADAAAALNELLALAPRRAACWTRGLTRYGHAAGAWAAVTMTEAARCMAICGRPGRAAAATFVATALVDPACSICCGALVLLAAPAHNFLPARVPSNAQLAWLTRWTVGQ